VALDATPLLDRPTGGGVFTAELLAARGRGARVDAAAYLVTMRGRDRILGRVPEGVRVVGLPVPARPLHAAWARTQLPPAEAVLGCWDVVHGTCFVVPPTWRAAQVVTVHDLTAWRFPELVAPASLAYPALVASAVRRGAWVHTPSEAVAEEVRGLAGVPSDRVVAVHHGVPRAQQGDPARGRSLAGGDRYVLAVGTIEPRKGYPDLVRAFGALAEEDHDLRLVIAGGEGWGAAAVHEALAALAPSVRERTTITGYLADRDRDDLVSAAAVLAYPSRYEGFGFPPLEAMAAGVPVVATDAGSLPEVLGDAAALVPVDDAGALAAALRRTLALEGDARAAVVAAGRAHAATFTWEACAAGLVSLYERAAAGA
jgi:glycosyltransferase involved in cell wall biosynthesis